MAGASPWLRNLCKKMPASMVLSMADAMACTDAEKEILLMMCGINQATIETLAYTAHRQQYQRIVGRLKTKVIAFISQNPDNFFDSSFFKAMFIENIDNETHKT